MFYHTMHSEFPVDNGRCGTGNFFSQLYEYQRNVQNSHPSPYKNFREKIRKNPLKHS